jgi:hypothetical protein
MDETIIATENLTRRYGKVSAVTSLSLRPCPLITSYLFPKKHVLVAP